MFFLISLYEIGVYGHGATASIRVSNTLDLGSNPSARAKIR